MARPAWGRLALACAATLFVVAPGVSAQTLAPFKDELFAYPPLTAISEDGSFIDVDYSEHRDIDERDEIPERRVRSAYVDLGPLRAQADRTIKTPAGPLKAMSVGDWPGRGPVVVFVHGRNGDRRLGMNDRTFGGNFNRLKNLMNRSGGLYVTVDAGTFSTADADRVAALIESLGTGRTVPSITLACASMGGEFCWDLLGREVVTRHVAAIAMLSANNLPAKVEAMRRAAGKRMVPLILAHGTRDKVFGWDGAKSLYASLQNEDYPVRFVSFENGNHGTPIRMIDWRDGLNWLSARLR